MPQKTKLAVKSAALDKSQAKKGSIRLTDLIPRRRVTGGSQWLFGASSNGSNQTKPPGAEL
jgi:hypothetical protein